MRSFSQRETGEHREYWEYREGRDGIATYEDSKIINNSWKTAIITIRRH